MIAAPREATRLSPLALVVDFGSPLVWSVLALLPLSFLLAAVEHGWQKLDPRRVAAGRTIAPADAMAEHAERVENALLLLRVAAQVALVMTLLLLVRQTFPEAGLGLVTLATGVVAFIWVTVFCRVLPGELGPAQLAVFVRGTMPAAVLCGRLLDPPLSGLRALLRKLTGQTQEREAELVAGEILSTVQEGERDGHLGGEQADMIESVLALRETEVKKLMTPRTEMEVIDAGATIGQARQIAMETGRSRYPLVENGDVDKVTGVVHVKDLLKHPKDAPVRAAAREAWFVPETKFCTELLADFRKRKSHLAVVLDEYGGTAGVITIEDVLEEIVGDITDEFDRGREAENELTILDARRARAAGGMRLDELNEKLSLHLPESEDVTTVGGFIFAKLGRLPKKGEVVRHENVVLRVDDVVDRRVERVTIEVAGTAA